MYLLSIKLTEMVCDRLNVEIEMMLDLDSREVKWRPPIKRTIASKDQGVDELIDALDEHFEYLEDSGELESSSSRTYS